MSVDVKEITKAWIDSYFGTIEQKNRIERWIYNGLHSFDFKIIRDKRPLWDVLMILPLIGVSLISFTGCVLTYKKLFRRK